MTIKTDGRDWRSHLEQMHLHRDGIDECLQTTKSELDKLQAEIAKTLEKITSRYKMYAIMQEVQIILIKTVPFCRERYINTQLEEPLTMYKQLSHLLAQTKEQYKQVEAMEI